MKKIVIFITAALMGLAACTGSHEAETGYDLRFNGEGKFRIMQLTDTHLCYEVPEEYEKAKEQMVTILERESPDFVIFTGDVVTEIPAEPAWEDFFKPLDEKGIPFAIALGNHDRERNLSERGLAEVITAHPANINGVNEYGYLADIAVKVKSADGSAVKAVLYCFDSFDYPSVAGFEGYGWFASEQVEWHRAQSNAFAEGNNGIPVPSYAFFHIPLPEYTDAIEKGYMYQSGQREENECNGVLNSGMFNSFLECADVHGVFVGHDHVNDYIAPYGDIALCYGRYSGYGTTYGNVDPHGIRIIELSEGDYGMKTWISLNDGGKRAEESFSVKTDFTMHPALSQDTVLGEGERLFEVPENGLWTFRKTRGRSLEVAIDDIVTCGTGNRTMTAIALEKGLHKMRVTLVDDKRVDEPFHISWRRAGCGKMTEIPEEAYR